MDLLGGNIREAAQVFQSLEVMGGTLEKIAKVVSGALLSGRKLLACGNGGSAAEAAHLTTEFVCRYQKDRRPYPAICLNAQGGDLTAIGNDYSFDELFARQVGAFGQKGDVLLAFTTSGNSENVRRALVAAKTQGVIAVAFLGKDGGRCAGLGDLELTVRSNTTARIQEAHLLLLHTLCERVEIDLLGAGSAKS